MRLSLAPCSISASLIECRRQTLALATGVEPRFFSRQAHPAFSPIGWHLGHIAYTESLWIAGHLAGLPPAHGTYQQLFAADGLPKAQRQNLPSLGEILAYLDVVRSHTLQYLNTHPPTSQDKEKLWHWLIQHEAQHAETIAMVLSMHRPSEPLPQLAFVKDEPVKGDRSEMLLIQPGTFVQGSDAVNAIDNERPAHRVSLARYWIDARPVSSRDYQQFVSAGGYTCDKWWSKEGWEWLQSVGVTSPLYCWDDDSQPVVGVSWYEADAYARFVGKRLPTESEWEKAFGTIERSVGTVWEWTSSWFSPYPKFTAFPYEGYSQAYFDSEHRVLRGGSWMTPRWVRRPSFRNWYHPYRRELFAGFRCAA
ncbi:MAG: SUMF1/EgtB/PvdO family nonheme iron enzyme [Cyanobacteria bacterium J06634_6]